MTLHNSFYFLVLLFFLLIRLAYLTGKCGNTLQITVLMNNNQSSKMNGYTNGYNHEPVILVHGGAWTIPEGILKESSQGVKEAAIRGYKCVYYHVLITMQHTIRLYIVVVLFFSLNVACKFCLLLIFNSCLYEFGSLIFRQEKLPFNEIERETNCSVKS